MTKFNFEEKVMPQMWRIKDFLPKGAIVGIIAQSSAGKSTFADGMCMYVLHGQNFLDKETEGCDVLIIDQDSQEKGFKLKIKRFHNELIERNPNPCELEVKLYEHLYFKDGTIYEAINSVPSAQLILIDAFNKVGGAEFDYNSTKVVANSFEKLKTNCIPKDSERTIVINHHATEKNESEYSAETYMTTKDFSKLAMGSSAFIESVDCYFILSSPDKGVKLSQMWVRPISKRVLLPMNPFIIKVHQDDERTMDLTYQSEWEAPAPEVESDIMLYFKKFEDKDKKESATVRDVYEAMGNKHGVIAVRESLKQLTLKGKLKQSIKGHNLFSYELNTDEVLAEITGEKND